MQEDLSENLGSPGFQILLYLHQANFCQKRDCCTETDKVSVGWETYFTPALCL